MNPSITKHPYWFGIIIFALVLSLFLIPAYFFHIKAEENFEIYFIYYISSLILSLIVIVIAYMQSQAALIQSKTNYLLKIDETWSSPEIIKAREVIHEFYLLAKIANNHITPQQLNFIIGQQILMIGKINKPDAITKFISLLNFLDFLETIGYMYQRKSLLIKDIRELSGNSIIYFYEIFQAYIMYRREKDPKFYKMFENLYLDLCKVCNKEQVFNE